MDSAYGSDDLRAAAEDRNLIPVVPAHPRLKNPWQLDKQRYRQRNEVERLFRRIKAYRRVFTRYDKLDAMFAAFVSLALILGLPLLWLNFSEWLDVKSRLVINSLLEQFRHPRIPVLQRLHG